MGVVNEAIEDGVGQSWITDGLVPVFDGQLAGDDCGGTAVAVFEDFQKGTPLGEAVVSFASFPEDGWSFVRFR